MTQIAPRLTPQSPILPSVTPVGLTVLNLSALTWTAYEPRAARLSWIASFPPVSNGLTPFLLTPATGVLSIMNTCVGGEGGGGGGEGAAGSIAL